MKNLLKILLILAFSAPVFASSTTQQMPDPASVTTDAIMKMDSASVNGWLASLTADQYGKLSSDVQNWMNTGLTMDQYNMLKPEVQALVTKPASM
ncbi:hypothetical protein A3306_00970 [Rickettsia bellii]|uniref:Uncharacterized protein n=3 Tax=Rickettsia bellii TaxID=33990 RepID=Q1RK31_RICBR|nr:DUF2673 domain-containing protein [Rickettsia bellii]ABE04283.1 unknown [Rickettsia bellii RML369-C]ABV79680.1 hypothetical protein A1I_06820 [Rickettsia bellii OSU 85-389]ARD85852.1 hypothetical protein A3306_00970 [Rickettsia bellii]KJV89121.1 hypothetical protein RBEAN4_0088 [Rickettsia bellii str. RML An4]KJV92396.1 hypothetical protein RBEMOGI_1025 [Rickettsia bellii str. RML Mogi]